MKCEHHRAGECTHAVALPVYGPRPSRGVCHVCPHYDGPPRGLGDVVHAVAAVTGVAAVVKTVAPDCGCQKRREELNRQFPSSP